MKLSSLSAYFVLPCLSLSLPAWAGAEADYNGDGLVSPAELEQFQHQQKLNDRGVVSKKGEGKQVIEEVRDTTETIEEVQKMLNGLGIEEVNVDTASQVRGNIPEGAVEIPEGATEEEIEEIVQKTVQEAVAAAEGQEAGEQAGVEQAEPTIDPEAFSYYFGYIAAAELRGRSGVYGLSSEDFDFASYQTGFAAGLSGEEPDIETFDEERLTAAMVGFEQLVNQRIVEMSAKMLTENAQREGVVTTESGLVYEVLKAGEGEPLGAMENKDAKVLYEGKLPDGTLFDGNMDSGQAVTFPLAEGALIPGFTEALKLMPVGAHYKLFIPAELAYGERAPQGIPANCALQFELIVQEAVDAPLPELPGAMPPGGMPEGMEISPEQIEEIQRMLEQQGGAPLPEPTR